MTIAAFFRDMKPGGAPPTQDHASAMVRGFLAQYSCEECNPSELLLLSELAIRGGRDDVARQALGRMLQLGDRTHVAHYRLGRIELAAGNASAAREQFECGMAADAAFPFNWIGAARALAACGELGRAISHVEKFCSFGVRPHGKAELAIVGLAADHLFETRERPRAVALYRSLRAFGDTKPRNDVRLATSLIAAGDHVAALEFLQEREAASRLDMWGRRLMAICLSRQGDHAEAVTMAQDAFSAKPEHAAFVQTYLDVLARSRDAGAIGVALERHGAVLDASAVSELQARSCILTGDAVRAAGSLAGLNFTYRDRIYHLCHETAFALLAAEQPAPAKMLIDRLIQVAPEDVAACLHVDFLFRQQWWEAAGAHLQALPPALADQPTILLKRFEHACFMRDIEAAEILWNRIEYAGLPNKHSMIARFRFLAEQNEWNALIDGALAWLDRAFVYAHCGYVLYRAAKHTHRQMELINAIDAIDGHETAAGLTSLRCILAFDIGESVADMDVLLDHPAIAAAPNFRRRVEIKREVMRRAGLAAGDAQAGATIAPPTVPVRRKRRRRNRRALFLCTNRTYLCTTIVALHSALEGLEKNVDVFIVVDDELAETTGKLLAEYRNAGFSIDIVKAGQVVDSATKLLSSYGLFTSGHSMPSAAYYRIYFAKHLQQTGRYERAIYMDGDVLLRRPLAPLFDVALSNNPLAARLEPMRAEVRRAIDVHRITDGRYFNSGVLVFDFTNADLAACLERTIRAIGDPEATLMFHDQCALNIGFRDHFADLDPIWNTTMSEEATLAGIGETAALLHFLDRPKPWSAPYNGEAGPLWFEAWSGLGDSIGPGAALELLRLSEA